MDHCGGARPRILFVDDEPNVLSALRRDLADEPFEFSSSTDPREALERIPVERPSVVVSDFYMPEMHGPDLLERVAGIDAGIVRLILTGKPDLTAVLAAVQRGTVYRFLIKPWDPDELRMSLHNAVMHHDLLSERDQLLDRVAAAERVERRQEIRDAAEKDLAPLLKRRPRRS